MIPRKGDDASERRAWVVDTFRQATEGTTEPLIESVLMLVAIQFFAVDDFWKGLLAASKFIGFLLTAPLAGILSQTDVSRRKILVFLTSSAALSFLAAAWIPNGVSFVILATVAAALMSLRQPFFTDLYRDYYPSERRAKLLSPGLRLLMAGSLLLGLLYGWLLEGDLGRWPWLLMVGAIALTASAVAFAQLPRDGHKAQPVNWWSAVTLPFRDLRFGYIQLSWMIIGFSNLWSLPLRAVYLAEADRGLGLSPMIVTVILVILPNLAKFLFNPLWARIYHRMSFPGLRVAINAFFITSIPLFFLSDKVWVISSAALLFGIGTAGSPLIWQLWVTRIAPREQTRLYQASHAFLAGVRGVLAPFIGLAVLSNLNFQTIGFISCALASLSTAMMIPLLKKDRRF